MAQVMVNFRLDEEIKKSMEQACREMGLSMTTAFTIFAKKVGSEKRIPFEITAESRRPDSRREQGEDQLLLVRKQERLELLCAAIRHSLTAIHTGIPASITGLSMERVRLLCGDELKDKAAGTASAAKSLFSSRSRESLAAKDLSLLDEYLDGLSAVAEEERAGVRVWLQGFTASWVPGHIRYGGEELRAQIQAVYDAGCTDWIIWNAQNSYTADGLLPAGASPS